MKTLCDGCGGAGGALRKVSLAHDFFGRVYDRLTPASDKSPAWYCGTCSEEKAMQTDYRAISGELRQWDSGVQSPLSDPAQRQRSMARLAEVESALSAHPQPVHLQMLLSVVQVKALLSRLR